MFGKLPSINISLMFWDSPYSLSCFVHIAKLDLFLFTIHVLVACHMDANTSAPAKNAISWKKPGVKYAGNFPMVMQEVGRS